MYLSNKLNTVCYESGKGIVKFNKLKKYCKYFLIKMISLECSRKTLLGLIMVSQESSHLSFLILSQGEAITPTMELSTKVIYLKSNIIKWQSQNLNSDL